MLCLKPNCELCDRDLPADSTEARICSYECTFCDGCVESVLLNVCPNCGGGFVNRPIRPSTAYRPGVSLVDHPPSQQRVHSKYSEEEIQAYAERIKGISPQER